MVSIYLLGLTWLFPGKWVYEVLISSQGLMQIGWCTINCRFNQEVHGGGKWPSQGARLPPPSCVRSAQDPPPTALGRRNVSHPCPEQASLKNNPRSFPQSISPLL